MNQFWPSGILKDCPPPSRCCRRGKVPSSWAPMEEIHSYFKMCPSRFPTELLFHFKPLLSPRGAVFIFIMYWSVKKQNKTPLPVFQVELFTLVENDILFHPFFFFCPKLLENSAADGHSFIFILPKLLERSMFPQLMKYDGSFPGNELLSFPFFQFLFPDFYLPFRSESGQDSNLISMILLTKFILFLSLQTGFKDVQIFLLLFSKIVKSFLESRSFVFADIIPFQYRQAK